MKLRINKLISIYEIVGGVLGLMAAIFMVIFSVISIQKINYPLLIFAIIALYILSLVAGVCLLKKKQQGIMLSIIVQIFQIPYIITSSFTYIFISGLMIGAKVTFVSQMSRTTGMFYLGSSFSLPYGSGIQNVILGINFIPILIIGYFLKIKNQIINKDDDAQIKNNVIS